MRIEQILQNAELSGVTLAEFSHLRVGGHAQRILAPASTEALCDILRHLRDTNTPHRFIGGGSNLLFPDRYRGVIVSDRRLPAIMRVEGDRVRVSSSMNINRLIMGLADLGLGGLEFLAGVPCHVGGALRMNAGAFGSSIGDRVNEATVLDESGALRKLSAPEMGFGYRHSGFAGIVIEALLRIEPKNGIREAILERIEQRRTKQPLTQPNLGCIFRNPDGQSAGRLIDGCGLKGVRVGDAMVSERHANFIVNTGHAQASDVLRLIERITCCVRSMSNIELELEIEVIQ